MIRINEGTICHLFYRRFSYWSSGFRFLFCFSIFVYGIYSINIRNKIVFSNNCNLLWSKRNALISFEGRLFVMSVHSDHTLLKSDKSSLVGIPIGLIKTESFGIRIWFRYVFEQDRNINFISIPNMPFLILQIVSIMEIKKFIVAK